MTKPKNRMLKKMISIALTILIFMWLFFYIKKHYQDFEIFKTLSWNNLIILFLSVLGCLFIQGLMLKEITRPYKIILKFREWFGINVLTTLGNYIVPFGGLGFRAAYLKKVYHFDYTYFLSTLGAVCLIQFTVASIGGMIGLLASYYRVGTLNLTLGLTFGLILLGCLVFLFLSPKLPSFKNKIWQRFKGVIESWYQVKKNKELVKKLIRLNIINFLLNVLIFYFSYQSLNLNVSLLQAFLPTSLSTYSILFQITPSSFGFYEGLVIYSSKVLELTTVQGLTVALLIRIAYIFWTIGLGLIFAYILIYKQKRKNQRSNKE